MDEFNLCVLHDSGVQEFLSDEDYPLMKRLKLGPNEEIAKIYIVEAYRAKDEHITEEVGVVWSCDLSCDLWSVQVAAWVKFSLTELQQFDRKFEEEMQREEGKIRNK